MIERVRRPKKPTAPIKKAVAGNGKTFTPAKGSGNGKGFEPGHKKSIGNRGPQFRQLTHFMSATLRSKLMELDPRTRSMRVHKLIDNLIKFAESDNGAALSAILAIFDRIEGRPMQSTKLLGSGPNEEIEVVTAEATLEQLSDRYASMMGAVTNGESYDE